MGELGAGSGSSYPGTLDTDATLEVASPSVSKTLVRAASINDVNAAVIAIETELGTDPAGTLTDVKTYLQTEHNTNGTQKISSVYAADAQANDTYVITLAPAPTTYAAGMEVVFKANTLNTGAATINVNSLGAKSIVKNGGFALVDGDIRAGQIVSLRYDGTNFLMQSPGRPFLERLAASNSGSVTLTTGGVIVASVTHNDVRVGDVLLIHAQLYNILCNTSTHRTAIHINKTGGTSAGGFLSGFTIVAHTSYLVPAGEGFHLSVAGDFIVTSAGTLTLSVSGTTTADTTTVDANNGMISSILLG